jgi:phospholipase C
VTPTPTATATPGSSTDPQGRIHHIVIVVQENRSFDNLFYGYPGADTATSGAGPSGSRIALTPQSLAAHFDLGHEHQSAQVDVDGGRMDGFWQEPVLPWKHSTPPKHAQYTYVPREEVGPYWAMAKWGVLGDRFFSELDASYVAHQFLIAGQAGNAVNVPDEYPWGCDARSSDSVGIVNGSGTVIKRVFPCFDYKTLGDELDERGVTWRYYAPKYGQGGYTWSAYDAIKHIRETKLWDEHVHAPSANFLTDLASGDIAAVTWVIPAAPDSDHLGDGSLTGPAWVSTVVNAVGRSALWNDTAIVVIWDDWGGLYDHVAPPAGDQFGPGVRVPLLVLSPFALHGSIAHATYTFGSVMRLVEDTFGLAQLTNVDASAASFGADVFDFNTSPRAFPPPFGAPGDRQRIMSEPPSDQPPDNE